MPEYNCWWVGTPNYTPGNYGIEALFPHWTAGSFDAAVSTLTNPNAQASAHYVIEGADVAQLVEETDSAWHCGNYYYNMRAIAYELVGWPGNPPSYDTLDTCARLMAEASNAYFDGAELVLGENVMLHQWVYPTQCPGETDVEWLVERANMYIRGDEPEPEPQPEPEPEPEPERKVDDLQYVNNWGGTMYRLYNPNGRHHFTMSEAERDALVEQGWIDEGAAWEAPRGGVHAVYRLYDPASGDHLLTADYNEAHGLQDAGWAYEGVPFFAQPGGTGTPVYRLYDPNGNEHFYTASEDEMNALVHGGWQYEGGFEV